MKWSIALLLCVGLCGATASPRSPDEYFAPEDISPTGLLCSRINGEPYSKPRLSLIFQRWFADSWTVADEPSVYQLSKQASARSLKIYRFTYLPSFDPGIIVRIEQQSNGSFAMTGVQLAGAAGNVEQAKSIDKRIQRQLTDEETARINRVLAAQKINDLTNGSCGLGGGDGSEWIIETLSDGNFKMVVQWSPTSGPVKELGTAFLSLSGFQVRAY